jgi:hypothetical protein
MSVTEIIPSIVSRTYLAGAQFADAYCIQIEGAARDAGAAAPLGLKTSGEPAALPSRDCPSHAATGGLTWDKWSALAGAVGCAH